MPRTIADRSLSFRHLLATSVAIVKLPARVTRGRVWTGLAAYRHLLHRAPASLTPSDRLCRKVLKLTISMPDRSYRRIFEKLSAKLRALPALQRAPRRHGLVLMIGTLGPGGAERQAAMTVIGLAERGYQQLRVICTSLQHESARFFLPNLEQHGVPVSDLQSINRQDELDLTQVLIATESLLPPSLRDAAAYIRAISRDQPLVVHLWLDEVNIKAGIAAVALGIPRIILGLRSLPPCNFSLHQPYMREAYRWLVKQPGVKLLNNSRAGARAYEHWLGIPEDTIRVVHNGFDFDISYLEKCRSLAKDYRELHGVSTTSPVIGTVIRLTEEKRPLLWLEIAAQVRRLCADAQFLVVGDGPLRSELELRADQEDLRGAVTFVGHEKKALEAMAAMDIFLLTSRAEGLPNVLVEAQAIGVPVVTTNVGGALETLRDRVTGWVLENDDSCYVADIIVRLVRDEAWRDRAKLAMPAFVRETFGLERMLNETLDIYGGNLKDFDFIEGRG
jgi:glycosyltransferase involved in cell wall biosynthesis